MRSVSQKSLARMGMREATNESLVQRLSSRLGQDRCGICGKTKLDGYAFCSDMCEMFARRLASWKRMRDLVRSRPKCEKCGRLKINPPAQPDPPYWVFNYVRGWREETGGYWVADHIIPLSGDGPQFDLRNLQLLCPDCNGEKTAIDVDPSTRTWADSDDTWK